MLMSKLFGRTLREDPAGATSASHRLLVRSAMIQQLGTGIYSYLPIGWRTLARIEAIIAEEMDRIGGQRIEMPVVHPADLWKQSGRWHDVGPEMVRFRDRMDHDMVLAMTHEEIVADLAAAHVSSYRDLPQLVYQIHTKFRDEPRSRAGLIRVREFAMKDAYSLHCDEDEMRVLYQQVVDAYVRVFRRCGMETVVTESSTGMMGGSTAHEFMLLDPSGEDTILICPQCRYTANQEVAVSRRQVPDDSEPEPLEEVSTPGASTIEQVASLLGVSAESTAKAVFYNAGDELVFAVIRGDRDINEAKLAGVLKAPVEPASPESLQNAGIVAGYASPVGVSGVRVVVDHSIADSRNLVGGANKAGFHLRNTNYPRDYQGLEADVGLAREGDGCPHCAGELCEARGIELGNTFQLGYGYSEKRGALYLDQDGEPRPFFMCSYGIGVGRILGAAVERWHDRSGMVLPPGIAPWDVHVVQLGGNVDVAAAAAELVAGLTDRGIEVLHDERSVSAGVKFNDADLLGLPLRVTVSARNLRAGQIEMKPRVTEDAQMVGLADAVAAIAGLHGELRDRHRPDRPIWDPISELDRS
jgi:prolyl-tRNA synthetase